MEYPDLGQRASTSTDSPKMRRLAHFAAGSLTELSLCTRTPNAERRTPNAERHAAFRDRKSLIDRVVDRKSLIDRKWLIASTRRLGSKLNHKKS
jgi:hypothetical protein